MNERLIRLELPPTRAGCAAWAIGVGREACGDGEVLQTIASLAELLGKAVESEVQWLCLDFGDTPGATIARIVTRLPDDAACRLALLVEEPAIEELVRCVGPRSRLEIVASPADFFHLTEEYGEIASGLAGDDFPPRRDCDIPQLDEPAHDADMADVISAMRRKESEFIWSTTPTSPTREELI